MRQDTVKHMDMDKSLSNKERFEKLKESRQKYKDEAAKQRVEARSASQKVESLEKQLRLLVAQVEAGDESKASEPTQSSKANGTEHAVRIDALTTRVSVLTAELERQKVVAARATNTAQQKTMEASEWRKKCDKAEKIAAAAADKNARRDGAGGVGAVSGDYAAYVYGALLGASAVAIIGYGALSYSMRAAR